MLRSNLVVGLLLSWLEVTGSAMQVRGGKAPEGPQACSPGPERSGGPG